MSDLSWHSFRQVVLRAFDQAAVRTDSSETKVLPSSTVEELHKILERCLGESKGEEVSADAVSLESVKKVYDMIGWDLEYSFTRDDVVTLLDALCGYESGNEQVADDFAELATKLADRAASVVFLFCLPQS